MADLQVKARNLCNIVSTTTLYKNAGGSGTFIRNNSISVYMNGNDNTSGVYIAILPESPSVGETFTISFVPVCSVDNVLRLNLFGAVQTITYTSGQRVSISFTTPSNVSRIIAFYGGNLTEKTVQIYDIQVESGSTAHNYQPYSSTGWVHSLRKLTTATEAITSGQTIYANGQPITTYSIKGNEEHTGTPSPQNPVIPQGTGNKTANLFNIFDIIDQVPSITNGALVSYGGAATTHLIGINNGDITLTKPDGKLLYLLLYAADESYIGYVADSAGTQLNGNRITGYSNAKYCRVRTDNYNEAKDFQIMLNAGSTALPYEPFGYKIPILTSQGSAVNYLGSVLSTRQIKKLVLTGNEEGWSTYSSGDNLMFRLVLNDTMANSAILSTHFENKGIYSTNTVVGAFIDSSVFKCRPENVSSMTVNDWKYYLQQQYAAGTPVTVWYVLATPTTAAVNEPLMKIGTYADALSNAASIPTTEGANSITVDTTVQPSEFTATWARWHNAYVKEKSENLFDGVFEQGTLSESSATGSTYEQTKSSSTQSNRIRTVQPVTCGGEVTISCDFTKYQLYLLYYDANRLYTGQHSSNWNSSAVTINQQYVGIAIRRLNNADLSPNETDIKLMVNSGQTALPYEPFWK